MAKKKRPGTAGVPNDEKERTFMNPYLLLGILLAVFGAYAGTATAIITVMSKSGKVGDMLKYFPPETNSVRGTNMSLALDLPGYRQNLYANVPAGTPEALKAVGDAMDYVPETESKGAEVVPAREVMDYVMTGKVRESNATIVVIRCAQDIKADVVAQKLGATAGGAAGTYQFPANAPGLLAGAQVNFPPTLRHLIVIPRGPNQGQWMTKALAGAADPKQSLANDPGDTLNRVLRGHTWVCVRAQGGNADSIANGEMAKKWESDKTLGQLGKMMQTSKVGGMWATFGKSVRFGAALECKTEAEAAALAKSLAAGDLGMGDDAEDPPPLKNSGLSFIYGKEWKEMKSRFAFKSEGTCVFVQSSLNGSAAGNMLGMLAFNRMAGGI